MEIEKILLEVNDFGRYQVTVSVLFSLFVFVPALHSLAPVYTGAKRDFHCREWSNLTASPGNRTSVVNQCSVTVVNNTGQYQLQFDDCQQWVFDEQLFHSTIISQYRLICGREVLVSLATFFYMFGYLFGCTTCGILSDKIGRVKALAIATLVTGPPALALSFAPHYYVYIIIRFFIGIGASAYLSIGATYISEILTSRHQTLFILNVFGNGFPVGTLFLILLAFLLRNHIHLQLTIAVISLLPLCFIPLIQESPRWLLASGFNDRAFVALRRIAALNSAPVFSRDVFNKLIHKSCITDNSDSAPNISIVDSISSLLTRRPIMVVFLSISFNFFAGSLIYFSLSLGCDELGGNIFITLLIMCLLEVAAHLIIFCAVHKIGQLPLVVICFIIGGSCSFLCIPFYRTSGWEIPLITLAVVGRFFITGAFTLQFSLCSSLFPTQVRNCVLGSCLTVTRLGAMLASVVFMIERVWTPLPFVLFGLLSVVAGLLSLALLPEVHNIPLPETMDQAELLALTAQRRRRQLRPGCCSKKTPLNDSAAASAGDGGGANQAGSRDLTTKSSNCIQVELS